jgi:abequosyltransferase
MPLPSRPDAILTIAIPTYNREGYLRTALEGIFSQAGAFSAEVEVIVCDNASSDGTPAVLEEALARGWPLRVLRNPQNIGPDANFLRCWQEARGRYFLLLGDDDLMVPGSLAVLLPFLRTGDYGVVSFRCRNFRDEPSFPPPFPSRVRGYIFPPRAFLAIPSYEPTFISMNVVNRGKAGSAVDPRDFVGSFFIQLAWTMPAMFSAKENLFIPLHLLANKVLNFTPLAFHQTVAVSQKTAYERMEGAAIPPGTFARQVLRPCLMTTLTYWTLILRSRDDYPLKGEDPFVIMRPYFGRMPLFWLFIWPAARLPLWLAWPMYYATVAVKRLHRLVFFATLPWRRGRVEVVLAGSSTSNRESRT